jgi:tyrosine-protein phosphatase YwqE
MVHFLSSDAHTVGGRSPKLSSAMSIIKNKVGNETLLKIIWNNQAVLNGTSIEIEEPIMITGVNRLNYIGNFRRAISTMLS